MQRAYPHKIALDARGTFGRGMCALPCSTLSEAAFGNICFRPFVWSGGCGADVSAAQGRGVLGGVRGIFRGVRGGIRAVGARAAAHALERPRRSAPERAPRL